MLWSGNQIQPSDRKRQINLLPLRNNEHSITHAIAVASPHQKRSLQIAFNRERQRDLQLRPCFIVTGNDLEYRFIDE